MVSILQFNHSGQHFPDYSGNYIKLALTADSLAAPDREQSNGNYEILASLYEAHRLGGLPATQAVWQTLKRLRPELAQYDPNQIPKLIHADQLKELAPPVYLLTSYPIYAGGFNVLVGPSGSCKSFLALDIAGQVARARAVCYIAGEGLQGYAARWEAWKDFNHCPTAELYFYTEALQLMDTLQLSEFVGMLAEHDPALVIIDTLARSAVGIEENSAKEMGIFIGACDALRSALQTSVLIIHHTGKSGEIRGSTALYGAADSVLALSRSDKTITVSNDPERGGKNKHSPSAENHYLQLKPHSAAGLNGAVLVEAKQMLLETSPDQLTNNQRAVLEAVASYGSELDVATIIHAADIKQSTCYSALKRLLKMEYLVYKNNLYSITEKGRSAIGFQPGFQQEGLDF